MIFKEKKKSNIKLYLFILLIIAIGVAIFYLKNSIYLERKKPNIVINNNLYWNLKSPLTFNVSDDSGVKFVQAVLINSNGNSVVVLNKIYQQAVKEDKLKIEFPKVGFFANDGKIKLKITAIDRSKWNFLQGNRETKEVSIQVDTEKPKLTSLTNSYSIIKGGSALVVFGAKDNNLEKLYIKTNFGKKFYPTPFYKRGYYASLLAWPITEDNFSATIVAIDKAKNITKSRVRLYLLKKRYKLSNITLKESFLDGKIAELAKRYKKNFKENEKIENFKFINEKLREKNEELIHKVASLKININFIKDFNIKPFYPLKNGAAVASFGDHRFFYYNGKKVSESYHLGIDLASIKHAKIVTSNKGKVIFSHSNGIYGNMLMIDHNLGLVSLYGHCSEFEVRKKDIVEEKRVIARSGMTGLALGDHLHFGVLVQGVEVRPSEWMDKNWIYKNITSILDGAKYIIDKSKGF